ncbi:helix-turn-helix domain-containing protein [Paenarthrobacter sp. Z7-10]|uniref:ArsR/SmtB family transcription factor n=1 Tax=Paenarthrobacter sp. Z7-10 TaxID=2787635 RepID=UPI0022A9038B|nr:transcriptional regulator [Paenarthrobacter sp. Z7-10]MCZ2401791.1 helix-turn-helix domain-containing protein [Paenarthrobacter sp. Z7-10]
MTAQQDPEQLSRDTERSVVNITDPQAIRALAHKVRLDVIDELFGSDETYTATELARSFGLTPSAMSYHLRALEKWGYVLRAASAGDGRERRWKAAGETLTVGDRTSASDLVGSTLIDVTLNATRDRINRALAQAEASGGPAPTSLMLASSKLKVTEAEAKEFTAEYHQLVERYRKLTHSPDAAEKPKPMYLTTIFVPEVDPPK